MTFSIVDSGEDGIFVVPVDWIIDIGENVKTVMYPPYHIVSLNKIEIYIVIRKFNISYDPNR